MFGTQGCTVNSRHGHIPSMVTFHLMAHPVRERKMSSLLRLNLNAYCPVLIRANSVYSPLTKSWHLNCLTPLSHCKHYKLLKVSLTISTGCQESTEHKEISVWRPVMGKTRSTRMTDSGGWQVLSHGGDYKWHSLAPTATECLVVHMCVLSWLKGRNFFFFFWRGQVLRCDFFDWFRRLHYKWGNTDKPQFFPLLGS